MTIKGRLNLVDEEQQIPNLFHLLFSFANSVYCIVIYVTTDQEKAFITSKDKKINKNLLKAWSGAHRAILIIKEQFYDFTQPNHSYKK